MKSIQDRLEERVALMVLDSNTLPTKAYLGKKEFKALNKSFENLGVPHANKDVKIARIHFYETQLEIVPTKHKSYFRVV